MIFIEDDCGREGEIQGDDLEEMVRNDDPLDVLKGIQQDPPHTTSLMFLMFVLKNAHGGIGKEEFNKYVHKPDDGDDDYSTRLCHLCVLTVSDIAFRLWQYINSHADWKHKFDHRHHKEARYICNTKFTSDRGSTLAEAESGESARVQGEKLYAVIMMWCKTLKTLTETTEYIMFRRAMIIKADEMGMLGTVTVGKKRKAVDPMEVVEAAVLDDVDFGMVAV
jgi:hypothetical protein